MIEINIAQQVHPFQANTYLISSGSDVAVIDPSVPFDAVKIDGRVKYILLTHAHFDHMLDINSWVENSDAEVIVSVYEQEALSDPLKNCYKLYDGTDRGYFGKSRAVSDGEVLPFGNTEIKVLECPGHTIGSLTFICDGCGFCGDTVFADGGFGRYDLPTGSLALLKNSIEKITGLDENIILYPGHGDSTTVKQYKRDIGK